MRVAVDDPLGRERLVRQHAEDAGAVTLVPLVVARHRLERDGPLVIGDQRAERLAGDRRAGAGVPAAARIEPGGGRPLIEHDDDGRPLLGVGPDRRRLDLLDQVVGVVVAAIDQRVAGAVAARPQRGARRNRALHGDAVHVVALVRLDEIQVADIPARQIRPELIEVEAGRRARRIAKRFVPLTAADRPVAGYEVGSAADALEVDRLVVLGRVERIPAFSTAGRTCRSRRPDCRRDRCDRARGSCCRRRCSAASRVRDSSTRYRPSRSSRLADIAVRRFGLFLML